MKPCWRLFVISLCLVMALVLVGCEQKPDKPPAQQSAEQVADSTIAQSQNGDAIVAGKGDVNVDKRTTIQQQIIQPLDADELIRALDQRQQQGMTDFQRNMLWLGWGVVFLLVSVLAMALIYHFIAATESRQHFIQHLRTGLRRALYRDGVTVLLAGLQRVYGDALSWRAFNTSLLLAYLYPFLLFVLAYSYFGGTHVFSGMNLFPQDTPWRGVYFPALLIFGFVVFLIVKYSDTVDSWGKAQLQRVGLSATWAERAWRLALGLGAACMGYYYLNADNLLWVGVWFLFGYWSQAFAVAGAVAGAFAGAGAVTFAGAFAVVGNYQASLLFAFFSLTLPLINALLDYLSWACSRYFMERTLKTSRLRVIALEVFVDALLGVLLLLALCLLLPAAGIGLDALYANWPNANGEVAHTNWQYYAAAAFRDPWGEGLLVTMMLLTTLLPTFLHILLGSSAVVIQSLRGDQLADYLQNTAQGDRLRYFLASGWVYGYGLLAFVMLLGIWQMIQAIWHLPLGHWLYEFVYFFYGAYDMVALS